MADDASRALRIATRSLLNRVEAGETLTGDGRPAVVLAPVGHRRRWVDRADFAANVLGNQADASLADDLAELTGEMTDDRPLP